MGFVVIGFLGIGIKIPVTKSLWHYIVSEQFGLSPYNMHADIWVLKHVYVQKETPNAHWHFFHVTIELSNR